MEDNPVDPTPEPVYERPAWPEPQGDPRPLDLPDPDPLEPADDDRPRGIAGTLFGRGRRARTEEDDQA